jgi:hypothetical protein
LASVVAEQCHAVRWSPSWSDHFLAATASPPTDRRIAVATDRPSAERGKVVKVRNLSSAVVDLAIHRVGAPDGSRPEWSCRRVQGGAEASARVDGTSGLYLVVATPPGQRTPVRYHPLVITDSTATAAVTVQVPLATYQAYNAWQPANLPRRSLYDFNSPTGRATSVEINRPYDTFDGAGFLLYGDLQLATWLHQEGLAVNYISSWDLHHRPDLLDSTRLFVSNFHDEYWTATMRDHVDTRVAQGMNAAFLAANSVYWQVELDGPVMHCDKRPGGPQGTFRAAGRPEADLLGSQYDSYRFPYGAAAGDWKVAGSGHWLYDGTSLSDGDTIERLVGYEWDRIPGDRPAPNVTMLASSPLAGGRRHHATIVERPGHGWVFNAGTTYWSRLLTGGGHWSASDAVQQITRNLMRRAIDG